MISAETDLTMSAPVGTIYYTLDGSDPRLTGGELGSTAHAYSGPINFDATTQVKARVRVGSGASAHGVHSLTQRSNSTRRFRCESPS